MHPNSDSFQAGICEKMRKVLITGGVRSGKSRFAIQLALSHPKPRVFLATAEPLDQEMHERIFHHQLERKNQFLTVEEPINLSEKILQMESNPTVVLIDCLTIWLGNLFHHFDKSNSTIQNKINDFVRVVENAERSIIIVTNEVGLGVISNQALGRQFVDILGGLNQTLAQICDEVIIMSCGIPQVLKGSLQNAKVDG